MTVILKNHKNGKEREFDDVEEAEDTRSELIGNNVRNTYCVRCAMNDCNS